MTTAPMIYILNVVESGAKQPGFRKHVHLSEIDKYLPQIIKISTFYDMT